MNFNQHLKIFLSVQKILSKHQIKILGQKLVFLTLAIFFGLFAIISLNISIFFYLKPTLSTANAALVLCSLNIIIALTLCFYAFRKEDDTQIQALEEIRDQAFTELAESTQKIQNNIQSLHKDVTKLQQNFYRFSQNPIGTLLPTQALTSVIKIIRAAKSKK